jgi:hypothetical protein
MVQQKQQQDDLKMLFQAAQGYQANYQSHAVSNAAGIKAATNY